MKLTFLGTSHGLTEKGHFCSSYAVTVGEKTYLVDAGAPITGLLQNYDILYESVAGIFITHMHHDHYIGLVEYIIKMNHFKQYKEVYTPVFAPDKEEVLRGVLPYFYGDPDGGHVLVTRYGAGRVFDDGTVRVTAIKNDHLPQNSYSLLVEAEGKRVLFMGDLSRDYHEFAAVLAAAGGHFDVLLMEAAHDRLDQPQHMENFIRADAGTLVITHRSPVKNDDETIRTVTEKVAPFHPVLLAADGMRLDI